MRPEAHDAARLQAIDDPTINEDAKTDEACQISSILISLVVVAVATVLSTPATAYSSSILRILTLTGGCSPGMVREGLGNAARHHRRVRAHHCSPEAGNLISVDQLRSSMCQGGLTCIEPIPAPILRRMPST